MAARALGISYHTLIAYPKFPAHEPPDEATSATGSENERSDAVEPGEGESRGKDVECAEPTTSASLGGTTRDSEAVGARAWPRFR